MPLPPIEGRLLRPFTDLVGLGAPLCHRNLLIIPLQGDGCRHLDYLLAAEAIQAGSLAVSEVGEGGSVPELLAINEAERMVLLVDGEELVGAKQNRVLNTTILIAGRSKTRIPVSCVEAGRWRRVSHGFTTGSYSSSSLRYLLSRTVSKSYMTNAQPRSDQAAVWNEVAKTVQESGTHSPTMAMHDVVEQHRGPLDDYVLALKYPAGVRGVIVAIGGKFAALDLFDKPATLEGMWPRLVTGYAIDALIGPAMEEKAKGLTPQGAAVLLEHVGQIECRSLPSPGVGEDWRFEAPDVLGHALVADGACVHLSAFPNMNVDQSQL